MNSYAAMLARDFEALTTVLDSERAFYDRLAGIVTKDRRITIRRLRPLLISYVRRLNEQNPEVYGYLMLALQGASWYDLSVHYSVKAKEGAF